MSGVVKRESRFTPFKNIRKRGEGGHRPKMYTEKVLGVYSGPNNHLMLVLSVNDFL